jgi:hypothetical protein
VAVCNISQADLKVHRQVVLVAMAHLRLLEHPFSPCKEIMVGTRLETSQAAAAAVLALWVLMLQREQAATVVTAYSQVLRAALLITQVAAAVALAMAQARRPQEMAVKVEAVLVAKVLEAAPELLTPAARAAVVTAALVATAVLAL